LEAQERANRRRQRALAPAHAAAAVLVVGVGDERLLFHRLESGWRGERKAAPVHRSPARVARSRTHRAQGRRMRTNGPAPAEAILAAYDAYVTEFRSMTRRARERFLAREWRPGQQDAVLRLLLYPRVVRSTVEAL